MDLGREGSYQGYQVQVCEKGSEGNIGIMSLGCWEGKSGLEIGVSNMNAGMYDRFLMDNMWSGIPCTDLLALADAAITTKGSSGGGGVIGGSGDIGGGCGGLNEANMHFGKQDSLSSFMPNSQEYGKPDGTRYLFDLNSPPSITEPQLITSISPHLTHVTPKLTRRAGRGRLVSDIMNSNRDIPTDQSQDRNWHLEVNEDSEDGSSDDYLQKTPEPKPKRRKHRPKVVIEGQLKNTKKSTTPKPEVSGSSTGKRKYTRKVTPEKSTSEATDPSTVRQRRNTCRRKINFEENLVTAPITPNKSEIKNDVKNTCSRAKRNINISKRGHDSSCSTSEDALGIRYESLEAYLSMITNFPAIYKKKRTEKSYNYPVTISRSLFSVWSQDTSPVNGVNKNMLGFGHVECFRKKRSKSLKRVRDLTLFVGMIEGKRLTCMEALAADFSVDIATKKRTKRNSILSSSSYRNHSFLMDHIGFHQNLRWKRRYDIDALINQFKNLGINNRTVERDQLALVPYLTRYKEKNGIILYEQERRLVPFERSYNGVKIRKPRPKVDIDDETSRVWRLLLEDINSQGVDGEDEDKTKWWEEERNVFSGRAASFIARMHLIQGDRRFSRWKGSVVDSVTGVFLTQNVSDHLSSSAFMNLAARYPLKSKNSNEPLQEIKPSIPVEEPCQLDLEETIKWPEDNSNNTELYEEKKVVNINELENMGISHDHKYHPKDGYLQKGHGSGALENEHVKVSEQSGITAESASLVNVEIVGKTPSGVRKGKKGKAKKKKAAWDSLRKNAQIKKKRERTPNTMDSLDYEAVRCADVNEIADTIKDRGMNNMLAERIKEFLNRLVKDHGSIDLEWLRDVPPDKAKEYLLSFRGLGLKSVECVRLLTLHHLAFPVDTNVGRIAVRLGWVPLQPLPESLQLHLLELYPVLESIQQYLWPRLCKLDQRTLYELHYQMITFGKVFCTKSKPNCNSCPMRGECRHFASAFTSARLALPAPEERSIVTATENRIPGQSQSPTGMTNQHHLTLPPPNHYLLQQSEIQYHDPVIEEPATPEPIIEVPATPEAEKIEEFDIEDFCEEIPTIRLDMEAFTQNLQTYMENNMELAEGDVSRALVALTSEATSIPTPKLKNVSQLRTEHQVYELPDSHPLLKGLDKREPDDPCSYLLAIWTPGETAESIQPPEGQCSSQESGMLCHKQTCFLCNSIREANSQTVRGTLLIPCRSAMRGSFPLNGTYFQVNEVFADHDSSLNPIDVPRSWLWNLPRRTVYFGTSIPTIFKGLTTEGIQYCFWRGFVCVRGFDQKTRAPRPLMARLHFPASKLKRSRGKNYNN